LILKKRKTFIENNLNYWNGKSIMILGIIREDNNIFFKKEMGERKRGGRGGGSLFSLEPSLFNKGITFIFITMRIQYTTSYLKSKSKNYGLKKML
jgi:hypothetical protein